MATESASAVLRRKSASAPDGASVIPSVDVDARLVAGSSLPIPVVAACGRAPSVKEDPAIETLSVAIGHTTQKDTASAAHTTQK